MNKLVRLYVCVCACFVMQQTVRLILGATQNRFVTCAFFFFFIPLCVGSVLVDMRVISVEKDRNKQATTKQDSTVQKKNNINITHACISGMWLVGESLRYLVRSNVFAFI